MPFCTRNNPPHPKPLPKTKHQPPPIIAAAVPTRGLMPNGYYQAGCKKCWNRHSKKTTPMALSPPKRGWRFMMTIDPMESTPPNIHAVRGTLAIKAAERVMPYWVSILPLFEDEPDDDAIPQVLLDLARDVVSGAANLTETWTYANDQWHVLSDVVDEIFEFHDDIPNRIGYVPETTLKALLESMGLETLKAMDTWSDDNDRRYTDDAASAAAIVIAGGGDTGLEIDEMLRHEFWTWWLTEAVPYAWVNAAQ